MWRYLIKGPWIVFVAYWIVSALNTRRTVRSESFVSRYSVMFIVVAGFIFLFDNEAKIGVLADHIFSPTVVFWVAGVVLTWIGIGIALWARWHLGQYWSGRVTLKQGHKLIRTGPYAHFRHPIYSGLLLAAIGGALAIDRWQCVVGVALVVLGFSIKAKKEESLLSGQFGEAFEEHRRQTGFLLPKF